MNRHNDPARLKIYGTPDLFVWAVSKNSEKIDHVRFIEVKKPREPLSEDQVNELHYLNFDLKVKAVKSRPWLISRIELFGERVAVSSLEGRGV